MASVCVVSNTADLEAAVGAQVAAKTECWNDFPTTKNAGEYSVQFSPIKSPNNGFQLFLHYGYNGR